MANGKDLNLKLVVKPDIPLIIKAKVGSIISGHKYLRRTGTPGQYSYIYKDDSKLNYKRAIKQAKDKYNKVEAQAWKEYEGTLELTRVKKDADLAHRVYLEKESEAKNKLESAKLDAKDKKDYAESKDKATIPEGYSYMQTEDVKVKDVEAIGRNLKDVLGAYADLEKELDSMWTYAEGLAQAIKPQLKHVKDNVLETQSLTFELSEWQKTRPPGLTSFLQTVNEASEKKIPKVIKERLAKMKVDLTVMKEVSRVNVGAGITPKGKIKDVTGRLAYEEKSLRKGVVVDINEPKYRMEEIVQLSAMYRDWLRRLVNTYVRSDMKVASLNLYIDLEKSFN